MEVSELFTDYYLRTVISGVDYVYRRDDAEKVRSSCLDDRQRSDVLTLLEDMRSLKAEILEVLEHEDRICRSATDEEDVFLLRDARSEIERRMRVLMLNGGDARERVRLCEGWCTLEQIVLSALW